MNIEFDLTLDDVEAYSWYHYRHSLTLWKKITLIIFSVIAIGVLFLGILLLLSGEYNSGISGIVIAAFFVTYCYIYSPPRIRYKIRKQAARYYGNSPNDVICKHKVLLSSNGMTDITDMGQSTTQWSLIEKMVSTEKYIFFTITGGLRAHIIPKAIFSDETLLNHFIAEVEQYRKEALAR